MNILKPVLAAATLGFIGYKLIYAYHIGDLWSEFTYDFSVSSVALMLLTLLLMPLNWHLETIKWKLIIQQHEPVDTKKAYKSVLSGITLGIITPNQIGNLAGKAIYLDQLPKVKGAVATLLGDIAQTFATLIIGSYGLLGLYFHLNTEKQVSAPIAFTILTLINFGLAFLFLHIHRVQLIIRWKWIRPYVSIATGYEKLVLIKLLLLSGSRFFIFTFQYYLLLNIFGIHLSLSEWAMSVLSIYVIESFAPSFIIIQLGIRGALALYFIGMFTEGLFNGGSVAILLSAYSLWIINLMIPGLLGLYFLLTHKWNSTS